MKTLTQNQTNKQTTNRGWVNIWKIHGTKGPGWGVWKTKAQAELMAKEHMEKYDCSALGVIYLGSMPACEWI